jgi:hypothetical protein
MTFTRRTAAAALVAMLALGVAACGEDEHASGSAATTTPTTSAPSGPTATTTSSTISIPLQVSTTSSGGRVVVQASIGGAPTVPMLLDTGSSGVVVASSALGSQAQTTTQSADSGYVGSSLSGVVANATVTMGGLTTDGSIAVVSAESATCETDSGKSESCSVGDAFGDGTQGIIGIGLSNGPSPASPNYSPLLQVAAPYDQGFTIQLPPSGNGTGALVVGAVSAPANATPVPFVASSSPTYPNGAKAFAKDFQMCWTVGSDTACGPTDLDIGSPHTVLTPSVVPSAPVTDEVVDSGTAVSVSATQGGPPLWSLTAGTTVSDDMVESVDELGPSTDFNSGIAFFYANVVAWDMVDAQLLVWAQ